MAKIQKVIWRMERKKGGSVESRLSAVLVGRVRESGLLSVWDPQAGHCGGSLDWYYRTRPARPSEYRKAHQRLARQYSPECKLVVAKRLPRQRNG